MKFPIEENEKYEYKESLAQLDKGLKSLAVATWKQFVRCLLRAKITKI